MKGEILILKENTEEIRDKIKQARIDICKCAEFKNSAWLEFMDINGVHGLGYSDETDGNLTVEQVLARFQAEIKNIVYCKDVDEFITKIKDYEN